MGNLDTLKPTRILILILIGVMLILSGCAVDESPAPELVDPTGFVTYVHPTGVFTLSMPPDWIVQDTSSAAAIEVGFSPPQSPEPAIIVYVTGYGADDEVVSSSLDLGSIDAYLTRFYESSEWNYKEIARDPQPDGSLRVKFLLDRPQGTSQHNDFFQVEGPYFVATRLRLPEDVAQFRTLTRIIETLTVNTESGWVSAADERLTTDQDAVGFASLNAWANRNGGFVIVGQVVNNDTQILEFVRITAKLYDADNNLLSEQDNFISSDMLLPGELTPFSIVFNDGLPPGTVRYDLNASARYANLSTQTFYGSENFGISSESNFDENGFLIISGQVRNEGEESANLVKVIITIFDEDLRVIGTDTTLVSQQRLLSGEASPFVVTFVELGGVPHTFLVTAQGVAE